MLFPNEILDEILFGIPDVVHRFRVAVGLRRTHVRDRCVPLLKTASMDEASRRGLIDLLDWWSHAGLFNGWTYEVAVSRGLTKWLLTVPTMRPTLSFLHRARILFGGKPFPA